MRYLILTLLCLLAALAGALVAHRVGAHHGFEGPSYGPNDTAMVDVVVRGVREEYGGVPVLDIGLALGLDGHGEEIGRVIRVEPCPKAWMCPDSQRVVQYGDGNLLGVNTQPAHFYAVIRILKRYRYASMEVKILEVEERTMYAGVPMSRIISRVGFVLFPNFQSKPYIQVKAVALEHYNVADGYIYTYPWVRDSYRSMTMNGPFDSLLQP